jgi:peptidoglycan/xylan/chitin deacetylase (PgdA/CDA1 family)
MLALTFDNLGEAADLERGLWPAGEPLGRDPSVTVALPRLLDALDALALRATFCVEALNCELHPDAVREIAARGHELAMHGWRHERWAELDAEREAELLARGRAAFAARGELTPRTLALLGSHGFAWCSPAGTERRVEGGVAIVPFAWELVDAYHRLPSFAALRERHGDPAEPLAPEAAADRLLAALSTDLPPVLILHPFLMTDDAGFAAARRVLAALHDAGPLGSGLAHA